VNQKFLEIHNKIIDFRARANNELKLAGESTMFYNGEFISGNINRPDVLFVGINPGFGGCVENQEGVCDDYIFTVLDCKYIEEAQKTSNVFARRIVKYLLDEQIKNLVDCPKDNKLSKCAETSYGSFFATKNVNELEKQLNNLSQCLRKEHCELVKNSFATVLNEMEPKSIVCIGKKNFSNFTESFGLQIEFSKDEVFYSRSTLDGIPVHGVQKHLSRPCSQYFLDSLKSILC